MAAEPSHKPLLLVLIPSVLSKLFVPLQQHGQMLTVFEYFLPGLEDVLEDLCVLEGGEANVIFLAVEDHFLGEGRYSDHYYVGDGDSLLDGVVVDEVEDIAGDGKGVLVVLSGAAEEEDGHEVQQHLVGTHLLADQVNLSLVHGSPYNQYSTRE